MRRAALVFSLAWLAPSLAEAETKTTVYTYNPDGALTSITETTAGVAGSTTTYLTWDNFEADPKTPSTGTVTAANGNLIGMGTTPGDDSLSSWHHDVLDRLVRVTHGQGHKARYQYHPDELLAASLNADAPSSDGLQHYYDQTRYPQVTNLYDRHTGELSSRHRSIRYLEDGTEQMLVRHRKDVDGVYELTGQTMSGYSYDPYGASLDQELSGTPPTGPLYSLGTNPFQYTHEFADAVSGAYYLRARWYLPGHQTFLQRDPARNLNRYGYANGNPVTNYDPGGRHAQRFGASPGGFFAQLEQGFLQGLLSPFGAEASGKTMHFSGRALKSYWLNPINIGVLALSFLVTPAASDLAAAYDIVSDSGPGVSAAFLKQQRAARRGLILSRGALSRTRFVASKLASFAVHHFAAPAVMLELRKYPPISRSQFNEEYARLVGATFGQSVDAFVFSSLREAVGAGVEYGRARLYDRDMDSYFARNRSMIRERYAYWEKNYDAVRRLEVEERSLQLWRVQPRLGTYARSFVAAVVLLAHPWLPGERAGATNPVEDAMFQEESSTTQSSIVSTLGLPDVTPAPRVE